MSSYVVIFSRKGLQLVSEAKTAEGVVCSRPRLTVVGPVIYSFVAYLSLEATGWVIRKG